MRVISIAHGPDADRWASLVGGSAAVRSSTSVEHALKEGAADVVIFSASSFDIGQVLTALDAGLHVVLEPSVDADPQLLDRVVQRASEVQRSVMLLGDDTASPLSAAVGGMLSKVGQISHVSCIHRAAGVAEQSSNAGASLVRSAVAHLESLQLLFGASPVRLMNRWALHEKGAPCAIEAFVELDRNIHIQYYGSEGGPHAERRLWIEGTDGSLLAEGSLVWWRKRGWPKFVPVRWRPGLARRRRNDAAILRHALALAGRQASSDSLGLLRSLARSAREGIVVDFAGSRSSATSNARA